MLPQLTPAFTSMANILQCNVFLSICTLTMDRALDIRSRSFSESHVQKILHLLGFAIQEELSEHYPFLSFYERAQQFGILDKLDELARCPRLEAHRDFVLWTIKRYKDMQAKQAPAAAAGPSGSQKKTAGEEPPLTSEEQARQEKETRAKLAAERRAKIMAQMQSAQKSFMKSNAEMFANSDLEQDSISTGASSSRVAASSMGSTAMDWEDISDESLEDQGAAVLVIKQNPACLGPNRAHYQAQENSFKCILCFENCSINPDGPPLVSSAFVQTSRVILTTPSHYKGKCGMHVSCCGHVMHYKCWQEYYSNEESKEQRRLHRNRLALSQGHNVEFHCPYCRASAILCSPSASPWSDLFPAAFPECRRLSAPRATCPWTASWRS
ncbi:E3 ubiquitin-protein ligase UBR1-like [Drosophila miranda]|uniref:E3 ubiquitin-protein ligase UBR1-like n=1 Tax=Drosophila miranda TaxID=7229 RepID=UPI00143F740E|nr:E3 ubiquitin-protein ligase UBR1-like [Drosophila miranda]